ncbi:MAG: glycosyltransferase family 1 protein [Hyphomicrobiales bacterium]
MRILIVTDAWSPQVNGVVRTLVSTTAALRTLGHEVVLVTPEGRVTLPMPLYPEIRLALFSNRSVGAAIREASPDAIYIATEGPLGIAARALCLDAGLSFATGFHSRFPEFVAARVPLPGVLGMGYGLLRWFHAPSSAVLAPTPTVARDIAGSGFGNVRTWTRGVDHALFHPGLRREDHGLPRPLMLYAGRVAAEKGIEDFLRIDQPGTKVVVGDGPERPALERAYPRVLFTGYKFGRDLAQWMADADVKVFPSRVDTFGLVMLEAMACGTPVAAYPVQGPIDVVADGVSGALDADLGVAIDRAVAVSRAGVRAHALGFTWERTAQLFADLMVPARRNVRAA